MTVMAEEVEVSDREHHFVLPESEIPILYYRDIGAYEGKYGEEYQHHTGVHMSLEFTEEAIV